jgi:6-phosphogluconolactonase
VVLAEFAGEAAALIAGQLAESIQERGLAGLVLAGGGTPLGVYRQLAGDYRVPWERVHVFWGDERLVPPGHPGSNYHAAWESFLSKIPIPAENIHRIKGELPAEAAVADYTEQLRAWAAAHDPDAPNPWPRFDLVLLGLGEDGHTASLFPGSPVEADAPVIAVTADYQGRPAGRVTLTPLAFNDAHQIVFIVSGSNKADAVYNTFYKNDPVRYPAQRIRPDAGEVVWLLDRPAAARLERPLTADHRRLTTDDRLATND